MSFEFLDIPETDDEILHVMWMPNGLPLFVADRDDVCDVIEQMGFSIYYLLANHATTSTTTTKDKSGKSLTVTSTSANSQMFKVVNNFIGRTVTKCNDELPQSIIDVKEEAVYSMPPIPLTMINKLDEFFRLIDAKYGTESIVLLTFDPTKEGSEGWGILVPDQTNTSVHCNYDPGSVIEHKPEHVLIVGSVHSHPGMAAYASGTDHQDQADFDGIHITFGWQKSVNQGATQYHIEMQMSGSAYTLKPEDVFEVVEVVKEPDPEVIAWSENVKKVLPPQQAAAGVTPHSSTASRPATTSSTTSSSAPSSTTAATTPGTEKKRRSLNFNDLPQIWRDLGEDVILVAEAGSNNLGGYNCPSCAYDLSYVDLQDGYCSWCYIPVITQEHAGRTTMEDVLSDIAYWCYIFDYPLDAKVYLWITNQGTENTLMPLTPGSLRDALKDDSQPTASSNSNYYEKKDYDDTDENTVDDDPFQHLMCCGLPLDGMAHCQCDIQMHPADVLDFDNYIAQVQMYTKDAVCNSCEFYYDVRCPSYRENLGLFLYDVSTPPHEFANTIDGDDCQMYEPFNNSETYSMMDYE